MPNFNNIYQTALAKSISGNSTLKSYLLTKARRNLRTSGTLNSDQQKTFDQGQSESHGSQSTSSTYREYYRKSYERKKFHYERYRENTDSGETAYRPLSSTTSHYERLNIEPTASTNDIKAAYYGLSKQFHPDIAGEDNVLATERFRLITESYDILVDPKSRDEYNKTLNILNPETTSEWRPKPTSQPEDVNFNAINRMRQADRLFRNKLDESLEREKQMNPRKFRAGTFSHKDDLDSNERVRIINDQMSRLFQQINFKTDDRSQDFYQVHMYDVLMRKRDAIMAMQSGDNFSKNSSGDVDDSSLQILLGLFAVMGIGVCYYAFFPSVDLESKIDSYFKVRGNGDSGRKSDA